MINYISARGCSQLIKIVDNDFKNPSVVDYLGSSIDWVYIIPEDGQLNGIDVKEGDIVFVMYGIKDNKERETIVLTDPKLKDYYKRLIDERRKYTRCSDCCPDSERIQSGC